jgi:hypothetical protein
MRLLNIFLIFIILYLCYKIFNKQESFQIKLSNDNGKPLNMNFNKNLYVNYDISNNDTQEIKKEGHIDLSKNNLIIKNTGSNKVNINNKLCLGSYCLDKSQLNLISGKVDAPQFKSKNNKDIYYNHDCNITSSNPKHSACIGDKEITSSAKLPHKLCFKSTIDNKRVDTCIESDKFDILLGNRGIKLKHLESNKNEDELSGPTVKNIPLNVYVSPTVAGAGGSSSATAITYDNTNNITNIKTIIMEINKLFFNKHNIHWDLNPIIKEYYVKKFSGKFKVGLQEDGEIVVVFNEKDILTNDSKVYTKNSLIFTLASTLVNYLNPEDDDDDEFSNVEDPRFTTSRKGKDFWLKLFYKSLATSINNLKSNILEHVVMSDVNINKMKEGALTFKNMNNVINLDDYDFKYFIEIFEIINDANKLLETTSIFSSIISTSHEKTNILYNDKRIVPVVKCFLNNNRKILHAYAKKYGVDIVNNDTTIINELMKYKDDSWKQSSQKGFSNDKYIMPYYADFKQTSNGIEGTKDQLFFTNHHECVENNTLYELNPSFNPRKYPYYKTKQQEINCDTDMCNNPLKARKCLHTCGESLLLPALKETLLNFNNSESDTTKYTKENYEYLKTAENKYINNNYNATDYVRTTPVGTEPVGTGPVGTGPVGTISSNLTSAEKSEMDALYVILREKLLSAEKLWNWNPKSVSGRRQTSKDAIYFTEIIAKKSKLDKLLILLNMVDLTELIRLIEVPKVKNYTYLSSAISLNDKLMPKIKEYTLDIIDNTATANNIKILDYLTPKLVKGKMWDLPIKNALDYYNSSLTTKISNAETNLESSEYEKLRKSLLTYDECSEKHRGDWDCSRKYQPPPPTAAVGAPTTTGHQLVEPEPTLIDYTGNLIGEDWHRICVDTNIPQHNSYSKGKKIYCLNKKSRDPNSISLDEVAKGGSSKKWHEKLSPKDRDGVRHYDCDGRPNWRMETASYSLDVAMKHHIMNYDLKDKFKWPEVMIYGFDKMGQYNDGEYTYGEGNKWVNKQMDSSDKRTVEEYISNIGLPKMHSKLSTGRRIHLKDNGGYMGFESEGILSNRMRTRKMWPKFFGGKQRKSGRRALCCSCIYGFGTGKNGKEGGRCRSKRNGGPDYPSRTGNHVNSCISDYKTALDFMNEYDEDNDIGYYILPDTEEIDPDYDGYYIDDDNHNLKYTLKQSAVATASKFLGNMDNHRVSHNGICGESNTDLTNNHFFCFGKNKNNPLYNKMCNPVTHLNKKVSDCIKVKKGISLLDEFNTEPAESVVPAPTTSSGLDCEASEVFDADKPACRKAKKDAEEEKKKELISECVEQIRGEENEGNLLDLPNTPKHIDEFYDLNYFIEPSKNNNGDLLKAKGYFHAHKHIHEDT